MNQGDVVARVAANPKFPQFVSARNGYSNIMAALMVAVYFGYILLIAFNKPFLATKLTAGGTLSIGIPLGLGVLLFTIVLTWIYVRRANTEFDAARNEIVKDASR